jgi:hypothetical protein
MTFIKAGEKIPRRSLVAGNPSKIIRQVSDEMLAWKSEGTRLYQSLPAEMNEYWRSCEPLHEVPENIKEQYPGYKTWNESKLQP